MADEDTNGAAPQGLSAQVLREGILGACPAGEPFPGPQRPGLHRREFPGRAEILPARLPVFAFWNRRDFDRFCSEVARISAMTASGAAGFAGSRSRRGATFRFVKLLKDGKSDDEALREAYGMSRAELAAAWRRAVVR